MKARTRDPVFGPRHFDRGRGPDDDIYYLLDYSTDQTTWKIVERHEYLADIDAEYGPVYAGCLSPFEQRVVARMWGIHRQAALSQPHLSWPKQLGQDYEGVVAAIAWRARG